MNRQLDEVGATTKRVSILTDQVPGVIWGLVHDATEAPTDPVEWTRRQLRRLVADQEELARLWVADG